jgi:hypothetical protein
MQADTLFAENDGKRALFEQLTYTHSPTQADPPRRAWIGCPHFNRVEENTQPSIPTRCISILILLSFLNLSAKLFTRKSLGGSQDR